MKRVKNLVVLSLLAFVTGCQKQSSVAQPVSQENDEVEQVIEEAVNEGSSDVFAESEKIELSEQDFSFEYAGNTFSISSSWSDYVDALGYPDEYEQNNYGYVSTNSDGYYWEMIYPSQSEFEYGFKVVFVSPSLEREGADTYIGHISLKQVETFRGVKAGDSVSDIADSYGKPDSITVDEANAEWSDITYAYLNYSLVFVVSGDKVTDIRMYDLNKTNELMKLAIKSVQLFDDEEIESEEWVDDEKRCYRVRICYKEQPEGEYKHSRDYFFYMDGDDIKSFEVDYPSVNDEDWDSDRYVGDACDFNAKLEDVTFDGKDDIVIFLGHHGTRGVMYSCAYIYTDTGFVYCRSFEEIPNYDIDTENMLITGRITSSAASYSAMQYSYDSSENRFVEINCTDYEYDEASGEYIAKCF